MFSDGPIDWFLQLREQRKVDQENNPHYLKAPSKLKVGEVHQSGAKGYAPCWKYLWYIAVCF